MAESNNEEYHEQEEVEIQEEEGQDNNASSTVSNSSFIADLNLLMMIASLTLSNEELAEVEEVEKVSNKERDAKVVVSKQQRQKRAFDELKVPDRRAFRVQPKMVDSRHGRRM